MAKKALKHSPTSEVCMKEVTGECKRVTKIKSSHALSMCGGLEKANQVYAIHICINPKNEECLALRMNPCEANDLAMVIDRILDKVHENIKKRI